MCNGRVKVHTPEEYEIGRRLYKDARKGVRLPSSQRAAISQSLIGNNRRKDHSPSNKGIPMSREQAEKLSAIQSNKRWVTDGVHNTCVDSEDLEDYLHTHVGWRAGFTRKKGYIRGSYKKSSE